MRFSLSLFILFLSLTSTAQKKPAYINGKIIDENENPLGKVSIVILGKQSGIISSDSGTFRIKVPASKAFALIFSYAGLREKQRNFY